MKGVGCDASERRQCRIRWAEMLEQQSIRRARAEVVTMGGRRRKERGDGIVGGGGDVVVEDWESVLVIDGRRGCASIVVDLETIQGQGSRDFVTLSSLRVKSRQHPTGCRDECKHNVTMEQNRRLRSAVMLPNPLPTLFQIQL